MVENISPVLGMTLNNCLRRQSLVGQHEVGFIAERIELDSHQRRHIVRQRANPREHLRATKDDFLYLDPAAFPADFAADVPAAEAKFMALSQPMLAKAAAGAPVTAAAWHQKKSWALVASKDHNINPDLERSMAKRAGSETIEVPASHAVYLSKPEEVARLIERAAKASAR